MVTTADLASDLGLSAAAVSMILNGKGRFAEDTRARVIKRARDLGYRPNAVARATRIRRFNAIALLAITPGWKGPLDANILGGCLQEASTRGSNLIATAAAEQDLADADRRPSVLRERLCDGLLMNYHLPPPPAMVTAVSSLGMPVMWLNLRLPSACAYPDDERGTREASERLIAMGHRRIGFLDFFHSLDCDLQLSHYSATARRAGCIRACADAGMAARVLVPDRRLDHESCLGFLRSILASPDRPDAIITYGPREALAVHLLARDLGLDVPRDLSLVQCHDGADIFRLAVDAVLVPFHETGRLAAKAVLDAIDAPDAPLPAIAVPPSLSFGRTTRER